MRYREMANIISDDNKHEARRAELLEAQEAVIACKLALDEARRLHCARRIRKQAKAEGFEGDELDNYVALRIRNATKRERQELEEAERRRDDLQAELDLITSNSEAERINAKIEQWDTLATTEQNAIVMRVFDRWETRGTDPDCYIVPILRDGRELPPIHSLRAYSSTKPVIAQTTCADCLTTLMTGGRRLKSKSWGMSGSGKCVISNWTQPSTRMICWSMTRSNSPFSRSM